MPLTYLRRFTCRCRLLRLRLAHELISPSVATPRAGRTAGTGRGGEAGAWGLWTCLCAGYASSARGKMLAAHPATARMTLSPSTRWKRQIGMVISAGMWQQIAGSSPVRAQR